MTTPIWHVQIPCTRAEATQRLDAIAQSLEDIGLSAAVTAREDSQTDDRWFIDVHLPRRPDDNICAHILRHFPGMTAQSLQIAALPETDWVVESQRNLTPVTAGRFFVHSHYYAHACPKGAIALSIEASRAFGTGQHESTRGCLLAIDAFHTNGMACRHILDIGTGSGILALAALKLWPRAAILATDNDPDAIDVARETIVENGGAIGDGAGAISCHVADGARDPHIAARAPYDLILANILAAPLMDMAPDIAPLLAPQGRLVLAGLLQSQAAQVTDRYQDTGLTCLDRCDLGDWSILTLGKLS